MTSRNTIVVANDAHHLARLGADLLMENAGERVARSGRCNIALSGGSTPRRMHRLLADAPYKDVIPWLHLHVFWVDERLVPVDDPASNYGLARKDFLERVSLPRDNIHPMPAEGSPEAAATTYQRTLEQHFETDARRAPAFDLIFLGVGTDGHTASIFPGDATAETTTRWVVSTRGGTPDVQRLTLTYTIMNCAERIVFLVSGASKARIVKRLLSEPDGSLPALKLHPKDGAIHWLIDRQAAGLLPLNGNQGGASV